MLQAQMIAKKSEHIRMDTALFNLSHALTLSPHCFDALCSSLLHCTLKATYSVLGRKLQSHPVSHQKKKTQDSSLCEIKVESTQVVPLGDHEHLQFFRHFITQHMHKASMFSRVLF